MLLSMKGLDNVMCIQGKVKNRSSSFFFCEREDRFCSLEMKMLELVSQNWT
jgi:shikimate kinase